MKKGRRYSPLLVALSLLLATSFLACSKPTQSTEFVTYENDTWGYTISYPVDWTVEVLDSNTTEIRSPYPGVAHIEIYTDERFGLTIEEEVQIWFEGTMKAFGDVILHESIGSKDSWDWYLAYDYFMPEYDMTFHGETYFKQTEANLYRVSLEAEKGEYSEYPFEEIVSTFALPQ